MAHGLAIGEITWSWAEKKSANLADLGALRTFKMPTPADQLSLGYQGPNKYIIHQLLIDQIEGGGAVVVSPTLESWGKILTLSVVYRACPACKPLPVPAQCYNYEASRVKTLSDNLSTTKNAPHPARSGVRSCQAFCVRRCLGIVSRPWFILFLGHTSTLKVRVLSE